MSNASSNPAAPVAPHKVPQSSEQPKSQNRLNKYLSIFLTFLMSGALFWVPAFLSLAVFQVLFVLLLIGGRPFDLTQASIERLLTESTFAQFFYVLLTEIFAISLLILLMRLTHEKWKTIGVLRPKPKHLLYTLGGIVAYFVLYIVVATLLSDVLNFNQKQELGFENTNEGASLALVFVSLVILPPIAEEIIFRGFLYTRFKQVVSVKAAALLVSLLFAAGHLQIASGNPLLWTAALDTFILSLVLVYVREKTGNIWAGVGIHALKNLVAFSVLFIHL